jgi:hypothetical protein
MGYEYKVQAFLPTVSGCGAKDKGWDDQRCLQFQNFINLHSQDNWKLHSSEYRQVTVKGCGGNQGSWLVCIFEKAL